MIQLQLASVHTIVGKRQKEAPLSRVKRALAVAFVSASMLVMMAAPAFAFHHVFIPGGPCGQSANSGGVVGDPQRTAPLPPVGTAAVEHSERITGTPTASCPAPNK